MGQMKYVSGKMKEGRSRRVIDGEKEGQVKRISPANLTVYQRDRCSYATIETAIKAKNIRIAGENRRQLERHRRLGIDKINGGPYTLNLQNYLATCVVPRLT